MVYRKFMQQPSTHYERPPDHYERSSKIMYRIIVGLSFIILVLVLGLSLRILWWTSEPELLARNEKGETIPLLEITGKPNGKVTSAFLNDVVQQGFQLSHDNFQTNVPKMKPFFVGEGYASYVQTLRDIGVADRIQQGSLVLQTDILEMSVNKEKTGMQEKNFVWVYDMVLLHTIRTPGNTQSFEQKYTFTLLQQPTNTYPFGVAVYNIKAIK